MLVHILSADDALALPPRGTDRKLGTLPPQAKHARDLRGGQLLISNLRWSLIKKRIGSSSGEPHVPIDLASSQSLLKLGTHHATFVGTTIVVCGDDGRRSSNDPHTPCDDRRMTAHTTRRQLAAHTTADSS